MLKLCPNQHQEYSEASTPYLKKVLFPYVQLKVTDTNQLKKLVISLNVLLGRRGISIPLCPRQTTQYLITNTMV